MARRLAKKANYTHQLGAVVVKKNRPIGFGFNEPHRTHPKSNNPFNTIHAELAATLGLSYDELKGAEIYVYRELKGGKMAMSRPCKHCMLLLKLANIKKVYYTSDTGYKEEEI